MKRPLLFLTGILLLPLCWGVARALVGLFPHAVENHPPWIAPSILALCAGYGCWTLVYLCLSPSIRLYIWGHELTHAIWGLMTGARVGKIRVTKNGGSVPLSQAGLFTTLAPYFVPFYTLVVLLLRLLLGLVIDMAPWELAWLFLIGLTWSHHATYTLRSLLQHQPDIEMYGRLFSLTVIAAFNLLLLGYIIVGASNATLPVYHQDLAAQTVKAYGTAVQATVDLACAALRLWPRG